jgi:type I restriction enzyme, S subunit
MCSEWVDTTIGDQIQLQRGVDITKRDFKQGTIPVVSSGGIGGFHDTFTGVAPGVILGRKGLVGSVYYLPTDYWAHDTTLWVKDFKGNHPKYVYYFFRSIAATLRDLDVGSANPTLNRNHVHPIETRWAPIDEQKAIAHILGTLDDKIELNRKTNETLEAMAKALFKSWFVDFDPVRAKAEGRPTGLPAEINDLFPDSFEDSELGEIPIGWSVGEIDQILNLQKDSLDPATAPDEVFDHYSIPAFDAGKYPAKELGSSIKSQKFLVADRDVLVSKLNPSTPRVWIPFASSGRRAICSTEFLVCRTSSIFGRAYAYCLASSDAIVEAMTGLAGGTSNSHQRIRPGDFLALPCCIGTEMVRSAFLNVVEPLLGKSLVLRAESRSLSIARDALLPKLISGQIRIPDAEKMLQEVGV